MLFHLKNHFWFPVVKGTHSLFILYTVEWTPACMKRNGEVKQIMKVPDDKNIDVLP